MSYMALVEIVGSGSLRSRIAACVAREGYNGDPVAWADSHMWMVCSQQDWVDAWSYAKDTATVNNNPDIGARDDVINDGMILAVVQPMLAAG